MLLWCLPCIHPTIASSEFEGLGHTRLSLSLTILGVRLAMSKSGVMGSALAEYGHTRLCKTSQIGYYVDFLSLSLTYFVCSSRGVGYCSSVRTDVGWSEVEVSE